MRQCHLTMVHAKSAGLTATGKLQDLICLRQSKQWVKRMCLYYIYDMFAAMKQ